MAKLGDRYVEDMLDRGHRELGAIFYGDSNIAQPQYPLRGGYEPSKDAGSIGVEGSGPSLAERLEAPTPEFKGPEHDEPDPGIERD